MEELSGAVLRRRLIGSENIEERRRAKNPPKPFSATYLWDAWMGFVHRGLFSVTIGATAVAASAVLWIASSPWLAWRILRLFPRVRDKPRTVDATPNQLY